MHRPGVGSLELMAEVQIHLADIIGAKEENHALYTIARAKCMADLLSQVG